MNLWLYSLRDMAKRPGRSLLTLFSIILGVGTVFAVSTTITGAKFAYGRMTETLTGNADAEIVARGGGHFAEKIVASLEADPAIQNTVPLLYQFAVLNTGRTKIQINGIGTNLAKQKLFRPFELTSGRLLENEKELVLDKSLADSAGIKAGDEVKILTRRSITPQKMTVVGLIRPTEVWAFTQGGLAYFDLADWQWWCKAEGKIDVLQIALKSTANKENALKAIADSLSPEVQLRSSREAGTPTSVTFIAFQAGLEATRALALLVAGLLILNTFLMNVTERRSQIAVMRLVGATRGKSWACFCARGARWFLGRGFGPAAWLATRPWPGEGDGKCLRRRAAKSGTGIGTDAACLCHGTRTGHDRCSDTGCSCRQDQTFGKSAGKQQHTRTRRSWLYPLVGALLVAFSIFGIALSACAYSSSRLGVVNGLVVVARSVAIVSARAAAGVCAGLLSVAFLGPMEFELAFRQMIRNRGRSLLTWGILFLAVATSVATGLILSDVINDIRAEVRRTTTRRLYYPRDQHQSGDRHLGERARRTRRHYQKARRRSVGRGDGHRRHGSTAGRQSRGGDARIPAL